jgi:hypothetical protein
VEILLVRFLFVNAQAFTVLPGVAPLARDAVCSVVNLAVNPTGAIKDPVVFLLLQLLQSLLVPLNLGESPPLRHAGRRIARFLAILG